MSKRKHNTSEIQQEAGGSITFQLSPGGIVGIGVVLFCLFLWIFLLGIWAGQTILHPPQPQSDAVAADSKPSKTAVPPPVFSENSAVEVLQPEEKKKRIAPLEQQPVCETQ